MMILEILKWIGLAIAILFGIGCIFALILLVALMMAAETQRAMENDELPFHCLISDSRCPTPELPCNECEIYQNEQGANEHDNQD